MPVNTHSLTVGLAPALNMPPPTTPEPPVIVNPSNKVSGPSPLVQVTTVPENPASMLVVSAPSELRSVIALPRKLMVSK